MLLQCIGEGATSREDMESCIDDIEYDGLTKAASDTGFDLVPARVVANDGADLVAVAEHGVVGSPAALGAGAIRG